MFRTPPSRLLAAGFLTALLATAAGCGSNDDPAEDASGSSSADGSPVASSAGGDVDAFCQAVLDLDAIASPDPDDPGGASTVTAFGQQIADPVAAIAAHAPAAAQEAAGALQAIQAQLAAGDGSVLADPATAVTVGTVEQAVADGCGFTDVAIDAVDYSFQGAPASTPAGPTNFLLTNASASGQEHVMLVLQSPDGAPVTPDAFVADPEGSIGSMQLLNAADAPPDATSGVTLDLTPGSYLLVCPISMDESSPPHFMLGMITQLTVT